MNKQLALLLFLGFVFTSSMFDLNIIKQIKNIKNWF